MWRVHRLDRINAQKPANLFDLRSLTLRFLEKQIGRFLSVSRQWQAALVGEADCGVGAEGRPTSPGDRFFEGLLAAHRGTAAAAGGDRKAAVYQEIETQRNGEQALTVQRMCQFGQVSRAGFYRSLRQSHTKIPIWNCVMPSSGLLWNFRATDDRE